jgi:hypothetical protein
MSVYCRINALIHDPPSEHETEIFGLVSFFGQKWGIIAKTVKLGRMANISSIFGIDRHPENSV